MHYEVCYQTEEKRADGINHHQLSSPRGRPAGGRDDRGERRERTARDGLQADARAIAVYDANAVAIVEPTTKRR